MRHTYQSPHVTPSVRLAHGRVTIFPASSSQQPSTHPTNQLNPDSYTFNSPIDFSLYIRQRHPGLVRTLTDFLFLFAVVSVGSLFFQ